MDDMSRNALNHTLGILAKLKEFILNEKSLLICEYRLKIKYHIDEFQKTLAIDAFTYQQQSDALYAICAFVDDQISSVNGPNKKGWAECPMQMQYFETMSAGVGFYKKLDALLLRQDKQIACVYWFCVFLGFKGSKNPKFYGSCNTMNSVLKESGFLLPFYNNANKNSLNTRRLAVPAFIVLLSVALMFDWLSARIILWYLQ